ncbi:NAD(P)-dependent oxidoreductase [Thermocatellispora tengchongensis]
MSEHVSAPGGVVRRVGFIGLGSQGGPMARRIAESGFPTTLWARRPAAVEPFADTPAAVAASPAELGAACDLVCVCVVDDAGVEEVVGGVLPEMAEGGIIAVHSTVHPDTCRRLAERAAARGVDLVDAPVSGGGEAALRGRLLVMAGGDARAVEACRPVFETYGSPVLHLGGVGAGQLAKILNNFLLTANLAAADGAYTLGRALGVDPAQFAEVVAHGSGASFAAARLLPRSGFDLGAMAQHAGPLLRKDVRLLADLADAAGAKAVAAIDAADAALAAMGHPR